MLDMGYWGGRKQILIVDDDPNIRRFITESLRLRGYGVQSFAAAEDALRELENHDFDLALLDFSCQAPTDCNFAAS
jgi:DNA-binding response OmpR family regulator